MIDLTHIPDSPPKLVHDIKAGDAVVFFPGIVGDYMNIDWATAHSITPEDGYGSMD